MDTGQSWNCSDSFLGRKFENLAPISCRPGPILSTSTVSFELHAKVAEEIDMEMCSYGQLSELPMVRDLDLRSGRGHTDVHVWSRSTHPPNEVKIRKTFLDVRTDGRTDGRT